MGAQVVMGATLQCSFGVAPSSLTVLPTNHVLGATPAANIMDNVPMLNVLPFGMCSSPSNPTHTTWLRGEPSARSVARCA